MDIEVLPDEPATKGGSIVYEQDLRAGAHRNGRAPHLVGPEMKAGGEKPPDPPASDDPESNGLPDGEPGQQNRLLAYSLAFVYLGAAALSAYVGITMLRDLRGHKENKT
jgi:hypothetical protein